MENPLTVRKNIFEYIDSLQDIESAKAAGVYLDDKKLKHVFWESFKTYFTAKSQLEKIKAKLKCNYINQFFGSSIPLTANINRFITPHPFLRDFYIIGCENRQRLYNFSRRHYRQQHAH